MKQSKGGNDYSLYFLSYITQHIYSIKLFTLQMHLCQNVITINCHSSQNPPRSRPIVPAVRKLGSLRYLRDSAAMAASKKLSKVSIIRMFAIVLDVMQSMGDEFIYQHIAVSRNRHRTSSQFTKILGYCFLFVLRVYRVI